VSEQASWSDMLEYETDICKAMLRF